MGDISTTVFTDEKGDNVVFDFDAFNKIFRMVKMEEKLKVSGLEEILAQEVGVTPSAIHNWRMQSNGPSDKEMIKKMASRFNLTSWESLTKKVSGEKGEHMARITDKQMESLKRVYDGIIDFLDEFKRTGGFTQVLLTKYQDMLAKNPMDKVWEHVENSHANVFLIIEKEYFYLHSLPVYEELCEYAYNDLYDIYDEKMNPSFRLDPTEEGYVSTFDDYSKALNRLKEIVEPYI